MPVDLPLGEWSPLLVGDQWPNSTSLEAMFSGAAARLRLAQQFELYAELLDKIKSQSLGLQEGITAEDARNKFAIDERHARDIATSNSIRSQAYAAAHRHVSELRAALRELASEGNSRIDAVNRSPTPLPQKIAEIVDVIAEIRGRALGKSAACAGEIYTEIQKVLATQGIDTPPRVFAANKGVVLPGASANDALTLQEAVARKLAGQAYSGNNGLLGGANPSTESPNRGSEAHTASSTPGLDGGDGEGSALPATGASVEWNQGLSTGAVEQISSLPEGAGLSPSESAGLAGGTGQGTTPVPTTISNPSAGLTGGAGGVGQGTAPVATSNSNPSAGLTGGVGQGTAPIVATNSNTTSLLEPANGASGPSLPSQLASAPASATPHIESPKATTCPSTGNPISAQNTSTPLTTANELAQNFNAGNQTGAPVSASAEAITSAATSPVHSAPPPVAGPMADAGAPATPAFESAHAVAAAPATEAAQVAPAPATFTQPVVANPTAAPITPSLAATPPVSAGPLSMPTATPPSGLLAYGADLRPATAGVPAAPPMPAAAAPGSAPVNPASGSSPTGQPAVVRQQPPSAAAQVGAAAGLTERAFAAAATGAAAGAGAAHSAAKDRLQRLLEAVARQQPKLNWAIADLEDGTTLLATDLAGGWVPPGVEIPTGVRLLAPAVRTGDLEKMLGPATRTAAYYPGQYLPSTTTDEPVAMSIRARDTREVDDLGWELSQATKWRDGLPRLAHTLAKAVSARTGHLDSEVELLRDYLNSIARMVLSRYPDSVIPAQVGNWQLLATIDALLKDEKTLANYHFAWFQAQVLSREGQS